MKKTIFTLTIYICTFFIVEITFSQWSGPVNLTGVSANGTRLTTNCARSISVSGNDIYAVWKDSRYSSSGDIYFRRSTNAGTSWISEIAFANNEIQAINPSIASLLSTLHVVWEDYRDGNAEIYYRRSTNGGANWGSDVRLSNAAGFSEFPAVAVSADGSVHVVWRDDRNGSGNTEIYYKRSTNGGLTWGSEVRLTNNSSSTGYPSIVTNGLGVHIAFSDYRTGNEELYHKRSTDNGTTWLEEFRITTNSASTTEPCITTSGLNLYISYVDTRTSHRHIYLNKSTNLGASWDFGTQLTTQYWDNYMPSIAISNNGNNIHIAYYTSSASNFFDVFYIRTTNGGTNWSAETRITQSSYGSHPQVAVSGNAVHIMHRWRISSNNQHHIQYWRNPTGNPTGINNIGSEIPSDFNLSQNYPNPFNPNTKIKLQIAKLSGVKLIVFDVSGRIVETLLNEQLYPGIYEIDFSASGLSSGMYFYKLSADEFTSVKKMMLVK